MLLSGEPSMNGRELAGQQRDDRDPPAGADDDQRGGAGQQLPIRRRSPVGAATR